MNLPACNQTERVRTVDGAHKVYTVNLFREALVDGCETVPLHTTATFALYAPLSPSMILPLHHVAFVRWRRPSAKRLRRFSLLAG